MSRVNAEVLASEEFDRRRDMALEAEVEPRRQTAYEIAGSLEDFSLALVVASMLEDAHIEMRMRRKAFKQFPRFVGEYAAAVRAFRTSARYVLKVAAWRVPLSVRRRAVAAELRQRMATVKASNAKRDKAQEVGA